MADTACTLAAERWLDEVILQSSVADVGAASLAETFFLPLGLGDVAIMSAVFSIINIATVPVTATAPRGARAMIISADLSTVVDVLGIAPVAATGGDAAAFTRLECMWDPEALALWRQGERLQILAPELDAGATGDLRLIVKAVRVRPIETPAAPIQLVR